MSNYYASGFAPTVAVSYGTTPSMPYGVGGYYVDPNALGIQHALGIQQAQTYGYGVASPYDAVVYGAPVGYGASAQLFTPPPQTFYSMATPWNSSASMWGTPSSASPYAANPYAYNLSAGPSGSGGTANSVTQLTAILNTQGKDSALSAINAQGADFAKQMRFYLENNPDLPLAKALLNVPSSNSSGADSTTAASGTDGTTASGSSAVLAALQSDTPSDARGIFKKLSMTDQQAAIKELITQLQTEATAGTDGTYTFTPVGQAIYKFLFKDSGYDKSTLGQMLKDAFSLDPTTSPYAKKIIEGTLRFSTKDNTGGAADPQYLFLTKPQAAVDALKKLDVAVQTDFLNSVATSFVADLAANNGIPSTDDHRKELAFLKKVFPNGYANALHQAAQTAGGEAVKNALPNIISGATPFGVQDISWTNNLQAAGALSDIAGNNTGDAVNLRLYQADQKSEDAVSALLDFAKSTKGPLQKSDIDGLLVGDKKSIFLDFAKHWLKAVDGGLTKGSAEDAAYVSLAKFFNENYSAEFADARVALAATNQTSGAVAGATPTTGGAGSGSFATYLQGEVAPGGSGDVMKDLVAGTIQFTDAPAEQVKSDPVAALAAIQAEVDASPTHDSLSLRNLAQDVLDDLAKSSDATLPTPSDDAHKQKLAFLQKILPTQYKELLGSLKPSDTNAKAPDLTNLSQDYTSDATLPAVFTSKLSSLGTLNNFTSQMSSDQKINLLTYDTSSNSNVSAAVTALIAKAQSATADLTDADIDAALTPTSGDAPSKAVVMLAFMAQWLKGVKDGTIKAQDAATEGAYIKIDKALRTSSTYKDAYDSARGAAAYTDALTDGTGTSGVFKTYLTTDATAAGASGSGTSGTGDVLEKFKNGSFVFQSGAAGSAYDAAAATVDSGMITTDTLNAAYGQIKALLDDPTKKSGFYKFLHDKLKDAVFTNTSTDLSDPLKHWLRVLEFVKAKFSDSLTDGDLNLAGLASDLKTSLQKPLKFSSADEAATWLQADAPTFMANASVQSLIDGSGFNAALQAYLPSSAGGSQQLLVEVPFYNQSINLDGLKQFVYNYNKQNGTSLPTDDATLTQKLDGGEDNLNYIDVVMHNLGIFKGDWYQRYDGPGDLKKIVQAFYPGKTLSDFDGSFAAQNRAGIDDGYWINEFLKNYKDKN